MPLGDVSAMDVFWYCLSAFFLLFAGGLLYLLLRLGGSVGSLTSLIRGLETEVLPVISKTGGTVDRVNLQLDKVDLVTTSAVDAADSADTAVRAVSLAITRPVQKVSGLAAGLAQGASDLTRHGDVRRAARAGRDAARRREDDIADDLARASRVARDDGQAEAPAGG
jgi:hypothetical protein